MHQPASLLGFGLNEQEMDGALRNWGDKMIDFRRHTGELFTEMNNRDPQLVKRILGENPEAQLNDVLRWIGQQAPQIRHRFSEMIFGDGDISNLVRDGYGKLEESLDRLKVKYGANMADIRAQAQAYTDSMSEFDEAMQNLELHVAPTILKGLTEIADDFTKAADSLTPIYDKLKPVLDWLDKHKDEDTGLMAKHAVEDTVKAGANALQQSSRELQTGGASDGDNGLHRDEGWGKQGAPASPSSSGGFLSKMFHRSAFKTFDDEASPVAGATGAVDAMQKAVRGGVLQGLQDYADLARAGGGGGGKSGSGGFMNASYETGDGGAGDDGSGRSPASIRFGRQHSKGAARGGGIDGQFLSAPPGLPGSFRPAYHLGGADLDSRVVNTIAGEVSTKNAAGVDAVINNMMNRVGSKGWGPSANLLEVARAKGQYAGYRNASPGEADFIRSRIAAIASGGVEDNTHGSNAYRAAWYKGPWGRKHANDGTVIGGNRFAYEHGVANGPYAPYAKSARPSVWEGANKAGAAGDVTVNHKGGAEITIKGLPNGVTARSKTDGLIDSVRLGRSTTMPAMTWS